MRIGSIGRRGLRRRAPSGARGVPDPRCRSALGLRLSIDPWPRCWRFADDPCACWRPAIHSFMAWEACCHARFVPMKWCRYPHHPPSAWRRRVCSGRFNRPFCCRFAAVRSISSGRICIPARRILVLTSDQRTPRELACLLSDSGFGPSQVTCWNPCGPAGTRSSRARRSLRLHGHRRAQHCGHRGGLRARCKDSSVGGRPRRRIVRARRTNNQARNSRADLVGVGAAARRTPVGRGRGLPDR